MLLVPCLRQDQVRESVKALVESMWSPDPADRPTFQTIVNKLQTLLKQVPPGKEVDSAAAPCCVVQ